MASRYLLSAQEELDAIQRETERQRAWRNSRNAATEGQAQVAGQYGAAMPTLPPGVVTALSKAGIGPDTRIGRYVVENFFGARARFKEADARRLFENDYFPKAVEDQNLEAVQRIIAGKDPTPEPGGLGGIFHDIGDVATTGVRETTGALQGGYEALTAVLANFESSNRMLRESAGLPAGGLLPIKGYEPPTNPFQSPLEQISLYQRFVKGKDPGSGFFYGGEALDAQRRAAAAGRGTVGGRAFTYGRAFAGQVVEPGSTAFTLLSGLVDAAAAIYADPAANVLSTAGAVRKARRTILPDAAGAIDAHRKWVDPYLASQWKISEQGETIRNYLTTATSISDIRARSGGKIDWQTAGRLVGAKTLDEVDEILDPLLGISIREAPVAGRFGYTVKRAIQDHPWATLMPHGALSVSDVENSTTQLERLLVNSKVPRAKIDELLVEASQITKQADLGAFVFSQVDDALVESAMDATWALGKTEAKRLFRFSRKEWDTTREAYVDMVGRTGSTDAAVVNGQRIVFSGPHLETELLSGAIPIPDMREVRRKLSEIRPIVDNGLARKSTAFADWFNQEIFKPGALLRGAWTVRVIGEEQVRMAAAGLDSLFHHPISYLAWVIGNDVDPFTGDTFADIAAQSKRLDPHSQALSKRGQGRVTVGRGRRSAYTDWTRYSRGQEQFVASWADEITELHTSAPAREVARAVRANVGLDEVKQSFWDGPLSKFRSQMRDADVGWSLEDGGTITSRVLDDRQVADAYIDSVFDRIRVKTADDPDLLDVVAEGKYQGTRIDKARDELHGRLEALAADEVGPEAVKGPKVIAGADQSRWDKAIESMFNGLMTVPTNKLSRSATFRQFMWQEVERLMPYMDPEAQANMLRAASKLRLQSGIKRRLTVAARKSGDLGLEQAEQVAKAHALDETRKLLYDVAERGNMFDTLRFVFPFGEAWKEVITRWVGLTVENPAIVRRTQQTITGARGAGFFYKDPETGEERFAVPGVTGMTKAFTGLPWDLSFSVKGLNIVGQGLPGVGPVVSIPAVYLNLVPDDPERGWVRDIIAPYGAPDVDEGALEAFFPGWAQAARVGLGFGSENQQRVHANIVKDAFTYYMSTGEYDANNPDHVAAALERAKSSAKGLRWWEAIVKFVAPSAPAWDRQVEMKDGRLAEVYLIANDYRKMLGEDPSTARLRLLDKYGEAAIYVAEPKGRRTKYGLPLTTEAHAWQQQHAEFYSKHSDVAGFWAPQTGEFDYPSYLKAIERGDIDPLSPEEWITLAEHSLASAVYRRERLRVPVNPTDPQRDWLRGIRDELMREFPGYDPQSPPASRASRERLMTSLAIAADDPDVEETDLAVAVRSYARARDRALTEARKLGLTTLSSPRVAHLRDWLRGFGERLVSETPDFFGPWDYVYSNEVAVELDQGTP